MIAPLKRTVPFSAATSSPLTSSRAMTAASSRAEVAVVLKEFGDAVRVRQRLRNAIQFVRLAGNGERELPQLQRESLALECGGPRLPGVLAEQVHEHQQGERQCARGQQHGGSPQQYADAVAQAHFSAILVNRGCSGPSRSNAT